MEFSNNNEDGNYYEYAFHVENGERMTSCNLKYAIEEMTGSK